MADDVVRLPHQLRLGKPGGLDELIVEVGQFPFRIGARDDEGFVGNGIFGGRDRKIGPHGSLQRGIRKNRTCELQVSAERI